MPTEAEMEDAIQAYLTEQAYSSGLVVDGLMIAAEADYRMKRQEIARLREALLHLRHPFGTMAGFDDVNDADRAIERNRKLLGLLG
ncbi:MAG: hypothetical protein LC793_16220 [Thermomicrobia bacterium]|nr:hypothetical protein [Thermomicrobia bacterium]MCA1725132.1 hypothetical protein [Thermomicrobia bacterium]